MKRIFCCLLLGLAVSEAALAKKDFKGLFGSYRREKFTENEARSTDFGMDLMLSTWLPLTPLVKSEEFARGGTGQSMQYATFFNIEGSLLFSLNYNFQFYANVSYCSYDTRKQNTVLGGSAATNSDNTLPLFHQFEFSAIPIIGGLRYRLSTTDIVPYIGGGLGVAFVKRRAFYDYTSTNNEQSLTGLTWQAQVGVEFYISSRMGIRLETSAMQLMIPAGQFDPGATVSTQPIFLYQANPLNIRYASGMFILF